MPRKNQNNWRDDVDKTLRQLVNNFNRKLTRLDNNPNYKDKDLLPKRQSVKDLREKIESYNDFRRIQTHLKKFTERGAENVISHPRGGKQTKYELDARKRDIAAYNRDVGKRRENLLNAEMKVSGLGLGYSRKEMSPHDHIKLRDIKTNPKAATKKERELLDQRLDNWLNPKKRREREQRMIDNYIKGLRTTGYLGVAPDLEEDVRGLSLDQFYDLIKNDEAATFEFVYGKDELMTKITALKSAIANVRS